MAKGGQVLIKLLNRLPEGWKIVNQAGAHGGPLGALA
jgi:hypothetical protein